MRIGGKVPQVERLIKGYPIIAHSGPLDWLTMLLTNEDKNVPLGVGPWLEKAGVRYEEAKDRAAAGMMIQRIRAVIQDLTLAEISMLTPRKQEDVLAYRAMLDEPRTTRRAPDQYTLGYVIGQTKLLSEARYYIDTNPEATASAVLNYLGEFVAALGQPRPQPVEDVSGWPVQV